LPELRELGDAELKFVSGGQQNSLTATLVATPTTASVPKSQSGAGVSVSGSANRGGRSSTIIDVSESNSTP
jgi:hypothetical protein